MNSNKKNKPTLSEGIVESIFTVKYSTVKEKEKQKQSIIDDFQTYRNSIGDSAPYPEITNYIFENSISELDSTLEQIENMNIEESSFDGFIESFKKHASLAIIQQEYIRKNSDEAEKKINILESQIKEAKVDLKKAKLEIKKMEKVKGSIYTEFIAILGIFSALIFGLFGGFSGLSEAIVSLSNEWSMGKVLIISSGIMLCLTLLIFGLLQWVARITDRKLTSCDCYRDDKVCTHSMFQRHRTLFSLVFSFIFIFILGEYIESYENLSGINEFAQIHPNGFNILAITIPILLLGVFVVVLGVVLKEPGVSFWNFKFRNSEKKDNYKKQSIK